MNIKKNGKKKGFHRFPVNNPKLCKEWVVKLKRKNFTASVHSVICSEHFEEDCFIYQPFTNRRLLKPGAVPTKFSFSKSTPSRKKTKYEFRQPLLPQDTTIEEKTRDVTVQTNEDFITDLLKRVNTLEPGNASLLEEVAQLKLCYDSLKLKGDNFFCLSSCLEDKLLL
ncbi:THAP domain-containing protein 1 [Biomphalaria glabrata]|nr:THAP domain-containing protein 1 [Biomphalaria glabrata]